LACFDRFVCKYLKKMQMQKVEKKSKVGAGNRIARRILPFFAPLFLASLTAPSKTVEAKSAKAATSFSMDALKNSNFQMSVLKIYEDLGLEQQGLSLKTFDEAIMGYLNLKNAGLLSEKPLLSIVEFDKPSTKKRFWLIDLKKRKVIKNTYVSHGKNSGENVAKKFSNVDDSNMSSLGFYITEDTYFGKHGLSLKLNGVDEAYNSNAKLRNIVMHGADYVGENFIRQQGRLGRSEGCPALPMGEHMEVIEQVRDRTVLFLHASGQPYKSRFLNHEAAMEAFYNNESII
jgi:hypothetical protein